MTDDLRERVRALVAEHHRAVENADDERALLSEAEQELAAVEEAQAVLQRAAQKIQTAAAGRFGRTVSAALADVFPDPYEFRIEFERKRGKTEARVLLRRGELEIDDLTEAASNGVLDVVALALRLTVIRTASPPLLPVLVLDEPFRCVSAVNREKLPHLLESLARDTGTQFILTTHDQAMEAGTVVRLTKEGAE